MAFAHSELHRLMMGLPEDIVDELTGPKGIVGPSCDHGGLNEEVGKED